MPTKNSFAAQLLALSNPTPTDSFEAGDDDFGDGTLEYSKSLFSAGSGAQNNKQNNRKSERGTTRSKRRNPGQNRLGNDSESDEEEEEEEDAREHGGDVKSARNSLSLRTQRDTERKYQGKTVSREELLKQLQPSSSDSDSDSDADSDSDSDSDPDPDSDAALKATTPADSDSDSDDSNGSIGPSTSGDPLKTTAEPPTTGSVDEIQSKLDLLDREDAMSLMAQSERREDEMEKARHTANQKTVFGQLFGVQMQLQATMAHANRLPSPALRPVFLSEKPNQDATCKSKEIAEKFQGVAGGMRSVVQDLLGIAEALRAQEDGVEAAAEPDSQPTKTAELWERINRNRQELMPKLFDVCDRQNRREKLIGGGSLNQRYQALNQSVQTQVEEIMQLNRERLITRSRTRRSKKSVIGHRLLAVRDDTDTAEDPEVYDDFDFYTAQLEKVMADGDAFGSSEDISGAIRSTGDSGALAALKRFRKKRSAKSLNRDRKASKGRKLRYTVHPKLLNFMAPRAYLESHLDSDKLFASLFKAS